MPLKVENVREAFAQETQHNIKILVAGPPGAGKTLTASTWPHPLYADAEGRLLSVRKRDVHAVRIDSTGDLDELKAALAQDPKVRTKLLGIPVETLVLDTVDELARIIIRERLKAEKQEVMRMADWGYLGDTLRAVLRGFRNLDLNIVLNVHLKLTEDAETGRVEYRPAIPGAVGEEIAAYVDEAFLLVARPSIDAKTGERSIARYFQTYPDTQHVWVKDHSGTLPLEFPINFKDDHARLRDLIFGDTVAGSQAVATLSQSGPRHVGKALPREPLTLHNGERHEITTVYISDSLEGSEAPAPQPVPPQNPKPAPQPDPVLPPAAEEKPPPACADCGTPIDNPDQVEISIARWGEPLCRTDFAGRKTKARR